eukprot:6548297-Prymnesium_polylepis.1
MGGQMGGKHAAVMWSTAGAARCAHTATPSSNAGATPITGEGATLIAGRNRRINTTMRAESHLATSRHISPHLTTSRYIWLHLAIARSRSMSSAATAVACTSERSKAWHRSQGAAADLERHVTQASDSPVSEEKSPLPQRHL